MSRNSLRNALGTLTIAALLVVLSSSTADAVSVPFSGNLQVWLKGDTGVTTGTGGVTQWNDQSGNGNNATQAVSADRPDVGGTLNGNTYLDFADSTDFFNLPTMNFPNGGNGMQIFLVSRTTDPSPGTVWLGELANGSIFTAEASGTNNLRFRGNAGPEATVSGDPEVFHISEYAFDGTSQLQAFYNSIGGGVAVAAGAEFIIDNIAGYPFGSNAWKGEGQLAEVLIYNRLLSAEEANQTGTYLSERYGIAAVNYNFVAPVPEPSSALLLGLGICGLLRQTRRQRRRKA